MYCKIYSFTDTMDMVNSLEKSEKALQRRSVSKEEWGQRGIPRREISKQKGSTACDITVQGTENSPSYARTWDKDGN